MDNCWKLTQGTTIIASNAALNSFIIKRLPGVLSNHAYKIEVIVDSISSGSMQAGLDDSVKIISAPGSYIFTSRPTLGANTNAFGFLALAGSFNTEISFSRVVALDPFTPELLEV